MPRVYFCTLAEAQASTRGSKSNRYVSRNQRHRDWLPRTLLTWAMAFHNDTDSAARLNTGTPTAIPRRLKWLAGADLVQTLIDRKHAAHAEQHQGHDERPEVDGAPVPQRVVRIGRPRRNPHASQQQALVAAVHQRMRSLRRHGRGPGDPGGHALGKAIRPLATRAKRMVVRESWLLDMWKLPAICGLCELGRF